MTIYATPNRNGNTPESFRDAARKINAAAMDLQEALKAAHDLFHGRNYQTVGDHWETKQIADVVKLQAAHGKAQEIITFAVEIDRAGRGD